MLHYIGRRARYVIASDGNRQCYLIRRLKCSECGRIHHELPDFIVPYKRYTVKIIEAAIDGDTASLPCYDSTIKGFQCWFDYVADMVVSLLDNANFKKEASYAPVSPLQYIKSLYGGANGWLAWAIGILVQETDWIFATRLLC